MRQQTEISVFEVVGSGLCVASDDGQVVHDQIARALRRGRQVKVSFRNIDTLTSAFLNAAVGQLYGEFSEEQIREGLSVSDLAQDDLSLLRRVVDTAKEYFKDPKRFKETVRDVLSEDDDQ